jgi:hypothetical protein
LEGGSLLILVYTFSQGSLTERGRLCTVDLLVVTSFDQLPFILKIFTYVTKQATLMRRSIVLSIPFQLVFPAFSPSFFINCCPVSKNRCLCDKNRSAPFRVTRLGETLQFGLIFNGPCKFFGKNVVCFRCFKNLEDV